MVNSGIGCSEQPLLRQRLVHEVAVLLTAGDRLIELKKTLHELPIDLLSQQLILLGVQSNWVVNSGIGCSEQPMLKQRLVDEVAEQLNVFNNFEDVSDEFNTEEPTEAKVS